jgi:Zn-dependent alcohol dehydrogenase
MRIRAAVVEEQGAPFVIEELELGGLRDDEVLVEIAASGICHTDLICRDQWLPVPLHAHFFAQSSFATYAVGRESTVVKVPDGMPLEIAAPFGCGIQTGAGAGNRHRGVPRRDHDLTGGRVVRGIVEGDSVPPHFLPRLYSYWQEGRFPVERMMTFYDFEQIEQAARDAESGAVINPVLRMSERSK